VADDVSNLSVEILKQIRDGITHLESNLGGRIDDLRAEMSGLRTELKDDMKELRGIVMQHGRIVDGALQVSLEDSGRLEAIEGRLRKLEEDVRALRERP
jgi:hypothetical protein